MLWWAACSNFPAAAIAPATSFASWTPRCSAVSSARHQESQGVCQRSPASAEPLCRCALVGSSPALHKDVQVPRTGAPGILPPAPLVHPCISQDAQERSEEHTSELQSLMRISYAVFCLKTKKTTKK